MAREAFDEFALAAVTRLYRAAYLMVGDHHQAEDLSQDVLARVYVAWPRISGDPSGYAYRALANAAANQRRWWGRQPEVQFEPPHDERSSPSLEVEIVERDEVVQALRVLPPGQRAVIVLRYYVDLTEAQTAQALNVSTGTVKSQNAKALARLREVLGEDLDVTEQTSGQRAQALRAPARLTPTADGSTT